MPKERRKNTDAAATPANGSTHGNGAAPSHDDIARRAHEIWLERGAEPGRELDHWLAAEQELASAAGGGQTAKPEPRRRRSDTRQSSATS